MSAWLVIEDTTRELVEVMNLEQVLDLDAGKDKFGKVIVEVYSPAPAQVSTIELANWEEFEKLINLLPGAESLGWIYIRDGKVHGWKGKLKLLEKVEEGKE